MIISISIRISMYLCAEERAWVTLSTLNKHSTMLLSNIQLKSWNKTEFDQLLVHMDIYHVIAYQRPPPGAVTIHKIYTDQRLNGDQDSVRIHNQMPMCSQHTKTLILANRHKKLSGNDKKNLCQYNKI